MCSEVWDRARFVQQRPVELTLESSPTVRSRATRGITQHSEVPDTVTADPPGLHVADRRREDLDEPPEPAPTTWSATTIEARSFELVDAAAPDPSARVEVTSRRSADSQGEIVADRGAPTDSPVISASVEAQFSELRARLEEIESARQKDRIRFDEIEFARQNARRRQRLTEPATDQRLLLPRLFELLENSAAVSGEKLNAVAAQVEELGRRLASVEMTLQQQKRRSRVEEE